MLTVLAAAVLASSATAAPPAALVAEFRARDQALLDAVTHGDPSVWDRAMDPGAIYIDEEGNATTKAGLLAQILPLPAGDGGHITITDYTLRTYGDVAVVVHKDAEVEAWHGQTLNADYITTETWSRRTGTWRLVLSHVYVVAKDPPAISVTTDKLDEFTGRYQAGPDMIVVIRRNGDQLVMEREGKPPQPMLVEATDVLFEPGKPRFRDLFQREPGGRVVGFIQRREGEDVRWTRLP